MFSVVRKETNEQGQDRYIILESFKTSQDAFRFWQEFENKLGLEIVEGLL